MDNNKVLVALTPSATTQRDYTGKVIQKETFTVPDQDGNPIHVERDVVITWETTKAIMAMIKDKAGV